MSIRKTYKCFVENTLNVSLKKQVSMSDSLSRKGKKIAILSKLARRNKIGMNYIPIEKTVSKIPVHARGDIGDIIDEMYKSGLLEYHENKNCISLNPKSVNRVIDKFRFRLRWTCREDMLVSSDGR